MDVFSKVARSSLAASSAVGAGGGAHAARKRERIDAGRARRGGASGSGEELRDHSGTDSCGTASEDETDEAQSRRTKRARERSGSARPSSAASGTSRAVAADTELMPPPPPVARSSEILPEPTPTLLLTQDPDTHKMVLHDSALRLLQAGRPGVPLVMVAMVGKARRGKSFLLNRSMLGRARHMFQVSSSSNACTKGVIMHGRPWPLRALAERAGMDAESVRALADVDVVFADTEGIDATDRTDGYDNNMLTFTCATAGAIIYNAVGPIDEDALSKISMIAEVGRGLLEENAQGGGTPRRSRQVAGEGEGGDGTATRGAFPSFHWCARDFALVCHDGEGREVTPDEYLEFQLQDQDTTSRKKNAMRRALRRFFAVRMCHTLPRPVSDEDDLRRVQEMDDAELKPQFMEAMRSFRARLFSTLVPKRAGKHALTGPDLAAMMQRFVVAINDGAVPNVQDSWQQVAAARAQRAAATAASRVDEGTRDLVTRGATIGEICATFRRITTDAFLSFREQTAGLETAVHEMELGRKVARLIAAAVDAWKAREALGGSPSRAGEEGSSNVEHTAADSAKIVAAPMLAVVPSTAALFNDDDDDDAGGGGRDEEEASRVVGRKLLEWFEELEKNVRLAARERSAEEAALQSSAQAGAGLRKGGVAGNAVGVSADGPGHSASVALPDEVTAALRAARAEELAMQGLATALQPAGQALASRLVLAATEAGGAQAGGLFGGARQWAEARSKYEEAISSLEADVRSSHEAAAQATAARAEAERALETANERLRGLEEANERIRSQLGAAGGSETRAQQLEAEMRELREAETRRMEEARRQMDDLEERMRGQVQAAVQEASQCRASRDQVEAELAAVREELSSRLSDAEAALASERRAGEMRERMLAGERATFKDELQKMRELLAETQSRFATKSDRRQQQVLEAAEERLRWSEQLREREAAAVRAEAEKASLEREAAELRERAKEATRLQGALEDARVLISKLQGDNEWLKTDRNTLREQVFTQSRELMLARQDLREARFSAALAAGASAARSDSKGRQS